MVNLIKAGFLTLGLTAWYIFPYFEQISKNRFNFQNTALWSIGLDFSFGDLIANSFTTNIAPFDKLLPNIGIVLLATILLAVTHYRAISSLNKKITCTTILLMILATNLFPWALFKETILGVIQFPWRLLIFVTFFACILAVQLCEHFHFTKPNQIGIFCIIITCFTISFNVNNLEQSKNQHYAQVNNQNFKQFYQSEIGHGKEFLLEGTDTTLLWKTLFPIINGQISENPLMASTHQYNDDQYIFQLEQPAEVQLPKFYYQDYRLKDNQTVLPYTNQNGLISVNLPAGYHKIEITYPKTLIQKTSVWFSFLIVCTLMILSYQQYRLKNK